MLEAMAAIMFLGVLMLLFGATFPIAVSVVGAGAAYNQAALIAQHKIDQLRQAGFTQLNVYTLNSLGVVDPALNSNGTLSFTTIDNLAGTNGYFGAGSTGSIAIGPALTQAGSGTSSPSTLSALQITVTITWQGGGVHNGTYTTHTVIAAP